MESGTEIKRQVSKRIDELDVTLLNSKNRIDAPVIHLFCHNMYVRTVNFPANTVITTRIHKTEHPFTLSKGRVRVMNENGEWVELTAPYNGITKKGTRRVVVVLEDCTWTTYHPWRGAKSEFNKLPADEVKAIIDRIEKRVVEKHWIDLKDKPLASPLQGAMDKDKDKDKEMVKELEISSKKEEVISNYPL